MHIPASIRKLFPGVGKSEVVTSPRRTASMKGKVKWFNEAKGYGFIEKEGGGDIFVHFSDIKAEGFRKLVEGQEVEFDETTSPKGPKAANVVASSKG